MEKVEFGIQWRMTDYCYGEIANFIECADNIGESLQPRYIEFLQNFPPKKRDLIDRDVLQIFMDDLDNRADIDYREGHWEDDEHVWKGGQRFAQRWAKLQKIHAK